MEQAVERLADDVLVQIEALGVEKRDRLGPSEELLVFLRHADLAHRLLDDWPERRRQLRRRLALEVVGGGGRGAVQDVLGVVDRHLADGVEEDLPGAGRGPLGGAVHAEHQLVDLGTEADDAQPLLQRLQPIGQQDLDRLVLEVTVGAAGQLDRVLRTHLQRLLEGLADLHVAERAGGRARRGRATGKLLELLEQLVELGGGRACDQQQQGEREGGGPRAAHSGSSWRARVSRSVAGRSQA